MYDANEKKEENEENTSLIPKEFGETLKTMYKIVFIGTIIFMLWYTVFIIKRE